MFDEEHYKNATDLGQYTDFSYNALLTQALLSCGDAAAAAGLNLSCGQSSTDSLNDSAFFSSINTTAIENLKALTSLSSMGHNMDGMMLDDGVNASPNIHGTTGYITEYGGGGGGVGGEQQDHQQQQHHLQHQRALDGSEQESLIHNIECNESIPMCGDDTEAAMQLENNECIEMDVSLLYIGHIGLLIDLMVNNYPYLFDVK